MSGHAAVSAYGRLTGDPRALETRTGNPMTVGRLAVSLPCRENGEDGEAGDLERCIAWAWLTDGAGGCVTPSPALRNGRMRST